jgi:LPXTG-motif cell wall-anchored protein
MAAGQITSSADSRGSGTGWWIALAVAVTAAVGGLLLWRRRSSPAG